MRKTLGTNLIALLGLMSFLALASCAQQPNGQANGDQEAVSGDSVEIPQMSLRCAAVNCRVPAGTYYALAFLTKGDCSDSAISYSIERRAVQVPISCTGTSCYGSLQPTGWQTVSGGSSSTLGAGTYNLCAFIVDDSAYTGNLGGPGIVASTALQLSFVSGMRAIDITAWP